jgi:actin-related protein
MDVDFGRIIVFDVGSSHLRVGVSSQHMAPKVIIPAVVGYPRQRAHVGMEGQQHYVGVDVHKYRAVCDVVYPISEGRIVHEADFRLLVLQAYELLGVASHEYPVVVTEPPHCPRSHRQQLATLFFGEMKVPAMLIVSQGACALFSCGEISGVVVDSGEDLTRVIAVIDGVSLPSSVVNTPLAGAAVTRQLKTVMAQSNQMTAAEHATEVKESLCFVRNVQEDDNDDELRATCEKEYKLPDGQVVTLSKERFTAPEVLFDSTPGTAKPISVPSAIVASVNACDDELRGFLLQRVFCIGGNTMLKGFRDRVELELRTTDALDAAARSMLSVRDVHISTAPSNQNWVGAAIMANLSSAPQLFTTSRELQDGGFPTVSRHRQAQEQ